MWFALLPPSFSDASSNYEKFPASVREQFPPTITVLAVYRHLGLFLFVSPLCTLQDLDLETTTVSTQVFFNVRLPLVLLTCADAAARRPPGR
jgi:hypothetical protein